MSSGEARPFDEAARLAVALADLLRPACERVAVAGSLRRHRPFVHDIELVAIARVEDESVPGLFESTDEPHDRLLERLEALRSTGELGARQVEIHRSDGSVEQSRRLGPKYQALTFRDVDVDLFIVREPAQWGVVYALRTGPSGWNERLVTDCQRWFRRVEAGQVWHLGRALETPTEEDFFRQLGQPWVAPADREEWRVRIDPGLFAGVSA